MGNFKLYFYGLGAKAVMFIGILVIVSGFFVLAFTGGELIGIVFSIIMMIAGVGIIIFGKSIRFDYQRQSGNIIHRGDW